MLHAVGYLHCKRIVRAAERFGERESKICMCAGCDIAWVCQKERAKFKSNLQLLERRSPGRGPRGKASEEVRRRRLQTAVFLVLPITALLKPLTLQTL